MRIGAAVRQAQTSIREALCQCLCVPDDAPLQFAKRLCTRDLECHTHGGKLVRVRATLEARKNSLIDPFGQVCVRGQDAGPARAAERLVGGERDHVGDTHGVGIHAGNSHACRMRNVSHEIGPHAVGDLAESSQVGRPGIGRIPGNDQLGAMGRGNLASPVIVEPAILSHAIRDHVVPLAGDVECGPVAEVSSLKEIHAHQGVPGC